jgi:Oxidoreductase family, NAD-binding Rossmann fold
MSSRRKFLGQVASGLGTLAMPGGVSAASDRVRVGIIGYGARGTDLAAEVIACEGTEITAICDIYSGNRNRALERFPDCAYFEDHRLLLEADTVDAVLIATPPHLHSTAFIDALAAGKHVYQERTMAFRVEDAKQMRAAWQRARVRQIVQIGHQSCSSGHMADAATFLRQSFCGRNGCEFFRCCVRRAPFCELATVLGLFGRERIRIDVPTNGILVEGAGPKNPGSGDDDGWRLSLEGRPRSSGHNQCFDGTTRRSTVYLDIGSGQRKPWRD